MPETALAVPERWRKDMQRYDEKKYLVLAPIELGPIPAMHTPMASVVKIDPDPAQGDVYTVQGKYAYSKAALDRVAAAAGISWLPEICGRTDAGTDPEIARFRMAGKRKELNGQWRVVVREYEFDLKAREEELKDSVPKRPAISEISDPGKKAKAIADAIAKDMIQLRKFKVQRAETGAADRVIRVFLGIKANYTREQISRPLVVPKLVFTPDYTDPEVKRFMLAEATGTISELYAAQAGPGSYSDPIVVHETPEEIEERKREALGPAPDDEPIVDVVVGGEGGNGGQAGSEGMSGAEGASQADPNLADEAAFREAWEAEAQSSGDLVTAFVAKQVGILKDLMRRKGFVQTATSWAREGKPLTEPLEKFDRNKRERFAVHLLKLPDAEPKQEKMPWA
jgi:hypothetical protein